MKLLTAALQQHENDLRRVVDRLRDGGTLTDGDGWLLREATELVGCLRRLVGFTARTPKEIHDAFGAPGDFGYETPIGEALAKIYRGESGVTATATAAREPTACQRCGAIGGRVIRQPSGSGHVSSWWCPSCDGPMPDGATIV